MGRNQRRRHHPYKRNNFTVPGNNVNGQSVNPGAWYQQQPFLNQPANQNYWNNQSEGNINPNQPIIPWLFAPMNNDINLSERTWYSRNWNSYESRQSKAGAVRKKRKMNENQAGSVGVKRKMNDNEPVTSKNLPDFCMNLSWDQMNQVNTNWIEPIVNNCKEFDKQMELLLLAIGEGENFYQEAENLCKILKRILPNEGITFTPKLYGSSKTGLAGKGSDYDIFLDFGDQDLPSINQIAKAVRKNQFALGFDIVTAIRAKVPIVRCECLNGMSCDISFTGPSGVYNSLLIKFLVSLDERIRPLILILKFWMKKNNLIDPTKISSYASTLLVIFYLQQLPNPILLPVYYLQVSSSEPKMVGCWNMSFTEDLSLIPSTSNNMSIVELIKGFFNFYNDFDFKSNLISVFLGKPLTKCEITADSLPIEYDLYKKYLNDAVSSGFDLEQPIWLQDPFVHNFNVARNYKTLEEFKSRFSEACEIVNKEVDDGEKFFMFRELLKGTLKQKVVKKRLKRKGKKIVLIDEGLKKVSINEGVGKNEGKKIVGNDVEVKKIIKGQDVRESKGKQVVLSEEEIRRLFENQEAEKKNRGKGKTNKKIEAGENINKKVDAGGTINKKTKKNPIGAWKKFFC